MYMLYMHFKRTPPAEGSRADIELRMITNKILNGERDVDVLGLLEIDGKEIDGLDDDEILRLVKKKIQELESRDFI